MNPVLGQLPNVENMMLSFDIVVMFCRLYRGADLYRKRSNLHNNCKKCRTFFISSLGRSLGLLVDCS